MKKIGVFLIMIMVLLAPMAKVAAQEVPFENKLEVVFLNVGKADAIVLITPNATVMIDTATNAMGKEVVAYLKNRGISKIDLLIITHFDKDHVGGADKVLENLQVLKVYQPDYVSNSKQYNQYKNAAEQSTTQVVTLKENITFEIDGVSYGIDVANQKDYGPDEENDFSLVTSVKIGEVSFLFAADAENPRLGELLQEGNLSHNVLKVPHHGRAEKRSLAFFEQVSPAYAIITSDETKPEDEFVVAALKEMGTTVYLTREGGVRCITDGAELAFWQE